MDVSPLKEIANELPFFKTVDDREKLLGVIGALVLRKITLGKASEIMGMEKERFLGLLDAMNLEYSYLENQDIYIKEMVKSEVFNSSPRIFLTKIGVIDSALNLFHPVYVPSSVSKEIPGKKDESAALLEELQKPFIWIKTVYTYLLVAIIFFRSCDLTHPRLSLDK